MNNYSKMILNTNFSRQNYHYLHSSAALPVDGQALLNVQHLQVTMNKDVGMCLYMMTSSNGNIFRVTGLCAGNSPVTGEFPAQRPVKKSFDIPIDLRLNKQLSK